MEKAEVRLLKPGTLLKVVPQRSPNVTMFFDIAKNEFFEVPKGEYVLFLKKSPLDNVVGLYEEKTVTVICRDVEEAE
jgi:hypothetical protein